MNLQNTQNPNLAKVELVAHVLGPLRDQLVFVGGCTGRVARLSCCSLSGLVGDAEFHGFFAGDGFPG